MFGYAANWIKNNWRWTLLNLIALAIMISLVRQINITRGKCCYGSVFDTTFMDSGHWAIRFLLISLTMTPLYRIFGWKWAIPLRKPAGLWAFGFAALHFGYYVFATDMFAPQELISVPYIMIGFTALSMLALMALTSNRWAMKWLGKTWKRLHRLVYIVAVLVIAHVLLALKDSKKAFMNPLWYPEFVLYGVIVGILLALRVSFIRNFLVSVLSFGRVKIKRKRSEQSELAME